MLRNNGDEPFETSQDGTVNHHWPRRGLVWVRHFLRGAVLEVEPFRELKVELDGRALERPTEGIFDVNVNLGTIESTISRVHSPLPSVLLIEGLLQLLYRCAVSKSWSSQSGDATDSFSDIPGLYRSEVVLGTRR